MKIVIIKDEHLQLGFRNKFRKPGWEEDLKRKHQFIIDYMLNNNIDVKITTGDILDKQTGWSFKQYLANKEILEMYKKEDLRIISIAGNHDMMEGRQTIEGSVFKEYVEQDLIEKIGGGKKSLFLCNSTKEEIPYEVELHGIDYQDPTQVSKEDFFNLIKNIKIQDPNLKQILVIHQNVTPNKERVTEFTYDEISKICNEANIDILITGHYHIGFPTININNVLIINPWNLWRVVRDYDVKTDQHVPEMVVLDTESMEVEHIIIPYKKYQNAFNLVEIDTYKKIKKQFNFIENVSLDINMDTDDKKILENIISKIKSENLSSEEISSILQEIKEKIDL